MSLLNSLGYRAKLKSVPASDPAYNPLDSRQKIQASLGVDYGLYAVGERVHRPKLDRLPELQAGLAGQYQRNRVLRPSS